MTTADGGGARPAATDRAEPGAPGPATAPLDPDRPVVDATDITAAALRAEVRAATAGDAVGESRDISAVGGSGEEIADRRAALAGTVAQIGDRLDAAGRLAPRVPLLAGVGAGVLTVVVLVLRRRTRRRPPRR